MSISEELASMLAGAEDAQDAVDADHRRVVLHVEDKPVDAVLMRSIFERRPQYRLLVAADGAQGLGMAATLNPALLVPDLRLQDCHGLDLLHRLRAMPHLRDVPAVAVTAELDIRPSADGFAEVWNKPLDPLHLLRRVDRLLDPDHEVEPLVPAGGAPAAFRSDPPATAWHRLAA